MTTPSLIAEYDRIYAASARSEKEARTMWEVIAKGAEKPKPKQEKAK